MDIASMIMGGSIASIAWIAFSPWAKLKRLQQLEADAASASGPEETRRGGAEQGARR